MILASLLLATLAAADRPQDGASAPQPAAPAPRASYVPPAADSREVRAAQHLLEPRRRQGRAVEELARELGAIGPQAPAVLVAMLTGDLETTDWESAGLTLAQAGPSASSDREILLAALQLLPEARVARALSEACANDAPLERRLVGLNALGELRSGAGVATWIELAQGIEPVHLERAFVRAQLDTALSACLAGSGVGFELLQQRLQRLDPALLPTIVRATAQSGHRQGVDLLFGLRGRERELDRGLLDSLSTLARATIGDVGAERSAWMQGFLAEEDARLRLAAVQALGRVRDPLAAPALIRALSDADPAVARSAQAALEALSGLNGVREAGPWEAWLQREEQWAAGARTDALAALRDPDQARAVEAMGEIALHPLFRHESAQALGEALARSEPLVVTSACAVLLQLDSLAAADALVELLAAADPQLRDAAHGALQKLTGRKLPPEVELWRRAIRG